MAVDDFAQYISSPPDTMAAHAGAVLGRALRESGQALERLGLRAIEKPVFKEAFSRHRNVMNLFEKCVRATAARAPGRPSSAACSGTHHFHAPAVLSPASSTPSFPSLPCLPPPRRHPVVATDAFVAPNATVVGRVAVNAQSSVWYGAVVRGDLNTVTIGRYSAIQDRAVVHTAASVEGHVEANTVVGDYVIIGACLEARAPVPPPPPLAFRLR